MDRTIEIRILNRPNGNRLAFYRTKGTTSKYWHSLPVRQAMKAIKVGRIDIGICRDVPAVAA